jgi:hypothetical protein
MKQCVCGLLVGFLLCTVAWAADDIAIIKTTQGDVTVKRNAEIITIHQADRLQSGDILITGKASRVGIIFHDGSVLSLEEKSFLHIVDYIFKPLKKKFNFNLSLKKGAALFESGKISDIAPEAFKFDIPQGTIGIRGTKFIVEVK